jgi:hypothetical protein
MPADNPQADAPDAPQRPIPFGIDADTGLPLNGIDSATLEAFKSSPLETALSPKILKDKADPDKAHFGTTSEVDPNELDQAGWAVIFAPSADRKIRDAFQPLLDYRKKQAGSDKLFKIFEGAGGCQKGDTASDWLARMGIRQDVVDPQNGVPYYVLIVGPPDEIPFEFQYGLDLYWAVGRVWFPTAQEFRNYAEAVIQYETMKAPPTSRQMAMFATRQDPATQLSHDQLVQPMVTGAGNAYGPVGSKQNYAIQPFLGKAADKQALHNIFSGSMPNGPPAFLLTASHGMRYNSGDPRQAGNQGALLCQDWPGQGGAKPEFYYAGADLPANAKVHGLIHFMFACYGGGCPEFDDFDQKDKTPARIAPQPMLARLPQALLGSEGGALAVLAHVERAWACSFRLGDNPQAQGFRDVISQIMQGQRLGQATDKFNMRWAGLSTELSDLLRKTSIIESMGNTLSEAEQNVLANKWVSCDDARNYVLFGDPAVRLRKDMPQL